MFKLQKHKSGKVCEKIDFQFSDFQAIKVPRGWDKLFVSIASVDTGKTIVKSGKASVKNGACRWTETFRESVSISQEKGEEKELQGCLVRFAVAMGSSRSGILGEVTVNLLEYAYSRASVHLSLLLKKCNYGTSIELKILCLTPKSKNRDVRSRQINVHAEYGIDDIETINDASDSAFSRNLASMSHTHLESTLASQAGPSRDPSLSASDSRQSFDSIEASSGNDVFSPQYNQFGPVTDLIVRQDSSESQISGPSRSVYAMDDDNRSNHSSVHSRAAESFSSPVLQQQSSSAASSMVLLEAAEVTIEELRAEARTWERNAKKLTLDVETLRKELSEQSRNQETLSLELSASHQECNGLNQEIKHLKGLLEESAKNQDATVDLGFQTKDLDELQKELDEEIRIHKDSNANLTEQLQKTQESNIELLSILQELEAIIETQKSEIENLSSQKLKLQEKENQRSDANLQIFSGSVVEGKTQNPDKQFPESNSNIKIQLQQLQETKEELESTIRLLEKKNHEIEREQDIRAQTLLGSESKWRHQLAEKEEEIMKLKVKLSGAHLSEENSKLEVKTGDETNLDKEIGLLRRKVEDVEDYKELTEENVELLIKIKEAEASLLPPDALVDSSCGSNDENSRCICGTEVNQLRGQLEKLQHELTSKETLAEHAATSPHSHVQHLDLQYKCHELEIQLQTSMEKVVHLENELQEFHVQGEEQQTKIRSLQQQIEDYNAKKKNIGDLQLVPNANVVASPPNNLSHILSELHKLLDHTLKLEKRKGNSQNFSVESSICCFHDLELTCDKSLSCEEQLHLIFDFLSKTNKCFEGECNRSRNVIKHAIDAQEEDINDNPGSLNGYASCISHQGLLKSKEVAEGDQVKELAVDVSEIKALKSDTLGKEEEIEVLQKKLNTLENQIANIRNENLMLQEDIQDLEREKKNSSESLEELKNENMVLKGSVESHITARNALERLSSDLGKGKEDIEQQLCELEQENVQLSERVSALETQLRCLTDEKETCLLDLRHSESQSRNICDDISRLEIEMEVQKLEARQKLQEMQNRWIEAQEECEYLKKANSKLQATTENLIEECTSLQKLNGELRRQNMELHTRYSILEYNLRDTLAKFAESLEKIEALEAEFLMLMEKVSIKANSLNSELDCLVTEDRGHCEKVMQENSSLNDMYMEKVIEVESYQREFAHLIDQLSLAHNDQETVVSEAVKEVSVLRADKAKLELTLQELAGKLAISQRKLSTLEAESAAKVKQLTQELTSLRQIQEVLMANKENLLVSVERFKSGEENHKSIINRLEIDLKASEYERLQLKKEISSLKEQLQRTTLIQAEVLDLKTSLSETKFEYEKLKALNDLLSRDHEELKAQKDSLLQKISTMQKSFLESEDFQRSKVALEEKVLRLEGDLAARQALCSQHAKLKFELSKMKRENGELRRKLKHLEHDQEQLQLKSKSVGRCADTDVEHFATLSSQSEEKQLLEIPDVSNSDYQSKIQSLETELAEAVEANEMYKEQLKRLLLEQNSSETLVISGSDSESDFKRQGINMLSMQLELRDLRDRYFQMSLKYAEVEAQREELVLKLKSMNNNRRWFS